MAKDESTDEALLGLVEGDYVIVGRGPDGGPTYGGTAHIELSEGGLLLSEKRGQQAIIATGRFEVPSPPNEGRVLRFRWLDIEPMLMTCLIGADLDNYARLTCYWLREGSQPAEPGLEAMFPTGVWEAKPEP
jgi:hypothetical protein